MKILILLLLISVRLHTETIEIISDMYTEEVLPPQCFDKINKTFNIIITDQKYKLPITTDYEKIKKYFIFNIRCHMPEFDSCPTEKKVLFMMEPQRIFPEEAEAYSRIYTWDDDMIDNKKYFKYYFPDLQPMIEEIPPFRERKLCTMIVRNWHPEHRKQIVAFFSAQRQGEFTFYGSPFPKLLYSKCYKGRIPGLNCGKEKIEILKTYRFCICTENSIDLNGYISEKIFACFAAGCVPIYWGAPNIEEYIPKKCYIDYRDFKDLKDLYQFITTMKEESYNEYLNNIRHFLNSDKAKLFSPENFAESLFDAVIH